MSPVTIQMLDLENVSSTNHNHHWTECKSPYCAMHAELKSERLPTPQEILMRPRNQFCDCTEPHEPELQRFLDSHPGWSVRKACNGWKKGKRICYQCDCLINPVNHEQRCGARIPAATPADSMANNIAPSSPPPPSFEPALPETPEGELHNLTKSLKEAREILATLRNEHQDVLTYIKHHLADNISVEIARVRRQQLPIRHNRRRPSLVGASAYRRGAVSQIHQSLPWILAGFVLGHMM